MSANDYKPNSLDAVLSRLEAGQKVTNDLVTEFMAKQDENERIQNGRISKLETAWVKATAVATAAVAAIHFGWDFIKDKFTNN